MSRLSIGLASLALAAACVARAEPITFNFKDPKGVNTVRFTMDAPLEAISGTATGISGEVKFDPAKPEATRGKIVVETASMHVPNPTMKEHMHAKDWMDVSGHPTLTFETESLANVKTSGNVTTADITGKLTLRGVTRTVTAPITITYLKDKLGDRTNGRMQGDLLVLRSNFTIKRSDFGINPGAPKDKVADEVELSLSLAGYAAKGS
jgi:polyisoprenoid-binding protein YceI